MPDARGTSGRHTPIMEERTRFKAWESGSPGLAHEQAAPLFHDFDRMPAVGSDWSAAQIAGIVHYLRQTKGGASGG